jgi:uncharacterized protein (DUF1501 family)
VLVMVTLDGGNDALNTVAPIDDPLYAQLRGSLALPADDLHRLSEGFALHPALGALKGLWDGERLAVVHGVGFDGLDRSHFHCRDVWQAGSETDHRTGWVGRWLDAVGRDPLDAVAVSRTAPMLVRGERRTAAVVPPGRFGLPGDARLRSRLELLSASGHGRSPLAQAIASSTADLLAVADQVGPVLDPNASGADDGDADDLEAAAGDRLGLDVVAALIEAELPTRVYAVQIGGFDTHAAQAPTHDALMAALGSSVAGFLERIDDRPVTVAVTSEFGRRVAPNASAGTDHGAGGTVLLAGNVRPGHHGEPPPLDGLVDGDLATTVDFRAVLGGLIEGALGIDAGDVLDSPPRPLVLV